MKKLDITQLKLIANIEGCKIKIEDAEKFEPHKKISISVDDYILLQKAKILNYEKSLK